MTVIPTSILVGLGKNGRFILLTAEITTPIGSSVHSIMITCPHYVDPLTPHMFIVKVGSTLVYIIFLVLLKNIDCGFYLQSLLSAKKERKISQFFI